MYELGETLCQKCNYGESAIWLKQPFGKLLLLWKSTTISRYHHVALRGALFYQSRCSSWFDLFLLHFGLLFDRIWARFQHSPRARAYTMPRKNYVLRTSPHSRSATRCKTLTLSLNAVHQVSTQLSSFKSESD